MPDVVSSSLTALPIHSLMSAPLVAAIEAQAAAAMSSVEFIRSVGFDNGDRPVTVTFNYEKTGEDGLPSARTLSVPLLSIINVPFIRIQDMTVDFDFKVHQAISRDVSKGKNASLNASGSARFGFFKFKADLKVSYSKKEDVKSSLDKSATFKIHMKAAQDDMPTGLAEVLDILKESIKETETETETETGA